MKRIYFICLTTTNFFYILYYIRRVQWNENVEKILVWAKDGKTRSEIEPYADNFDRVFYLDFADFRFPFKSQIDKLLKAGRLFTFSKLGRFMKESVNNNLLVCFNDWDYCTKKYIDFFSRYDNNEIVMMDEGTALYFDKMLNPPPRAAYFINRILGARFNISVGADPKINVIMAHHPERLSESKIREHEVLTQNDIFRDKEFLHYIQDQLTDHLPEKKGKCVLWLGQPVEELGLGKYQEEALLQIFQTFSANSYQILVKPHPRESIEKYQKICVSAGIGDNLKILDLGELYWIPIEAYITMLAPDAIAGFFSTAAAQIRDLGYICDTWYCYDMLKVGLENDYLLKEVGKERTFRIRSAEELKEKLKDRNPEVAYRIPANNPNMDIAFFESFGKENNHD